MAALDGDLMTDMEVYGEAKVACENAVRDADGTATIVRSGLIGGEKLAAHLEAAIGQIHDQRGETSVGRRQ